MIIKAIKVFQARGIDGLIRAIKIYLRGLSAGRSKSFPDYKNMFYEKSGIEIGGASRVFTRHGVFPVYPIAGRIDNCNFGASTVWEGDIKQGQTFQFDRKKPPGRQYVVEATNLESIPTGEYDFVLSSHMLEHTANPILALTEWARILKEDGALVLLLPHKNKTFDHRRPVTTMQHLIADYNAGMNEQDLTHMLEILALHDLERDPGAGDLISFQERSMRNFENRCFHHHVFDTKLAVSLVDYMGLQIQAVEEIEPLHILIVAIKISADKLPNNSFFTSESAQYQFG